MRREVVLKTEGLVGFVEAFREVAKKSGVQKNDIVIFSGCPGSCFPTASDFAFAIQDLDAIMYWVPDADLKETRRLQMVENVNFFRDVGWENKLSFDYIIELDLCAVEVLQFKKIVFRST